jgi:hypothetical protein
VARAPVPGSLSSVLDWHLERYPLLQADDIYKLVHQGVFGPGHLIADEFHARHYLEQEFAGLSSLVPGPQSPTPPPLTEPLDPRGVLVRLNLEPLRFRPDAVDLVLRALLGTAGSTHGSKEQMAAGLDDAAAWCARSLPDQCARLSELGAQASAAGYPPRHHSALYVAAYRPAYRVVSLELWKRMRSGTGG